MADQVIKPVEPVTKTANTLQKKKHTKKNEAPAGPKKPQVKPDKNGGIDTYA